jgi:diaminopropionate ammonia-lyase
VRALVNPAYRPDAVPVPSAAARAFHRTLHGYRPTPVHSLDRLAAELGVGAILVKDESARLGLPAFKILGASWAIETLLLQRPDTRLLVAASAGNHGRAVAHVAAARGLRCRVYVPARSTAARRLAIAREGAEVVVVDGDYEDAVEVAGRAGAAAGAAEIADVGDGACARDVIDGYATLFEEASDSHSYDALVVPVGVGSLAAAAARHGAQAGVRVVGVEPATAACLTASLAAGRPTRIATPGSRMAGLDCASVSPAAWPTLEPGIVGTVAVDDAEAAAAVDELAAAGLAIGDSGAAPLAATRALLADPACGDLRRAIGLGSRSRILLIATEGRTDRPS